MKTPPRLAHLALVLLALKMAAPAVDIPITLEKPGNVSAAIALGALGVSSMC